MVRRLKQIIPLIVIGVICYYLATRVQWNVTLQTLSQISPLTIVMSIGMTMVAAITMLTVHFALLLPGTGFRIILQVDAINARVLGYSTVLPTAVVAAYKIAAFQKIFKSSAKAIAFFAIGKLCTFLVALLALLYIGYSSNHFQKFADQKFGSLPFLEWAVGLLICFMLLVNFGPFRRLIVSAAASVAPQGLIASLKETKSILSLRAWSAGIATQVVAYLLTAGVSALLAIAINPGFPLEGVYVARAVTLIALLAPISIAGVGAREVSYLAVLPLYSVSVNDIASLVVLLLVTQWVSGLVAFVYSIAIHRRVNEQ